MCSLSPSVLGVEYMSIVENAESIYFLNLRSSKMGCVLVAMDRAVTVAQFVHCTAIFSGARLATGLMGPDAEAGNSRLSGMYSTESPLAGADVPRGERLCQGKAGAVQRFHAIRHPGLDMSGGTCARVLTPE